MQDVRCGAASAHRVTDHDCLDRFGVYVGITPIVSGDHRIFVYACDYCCAAFLSHTPPTHDDEGRIGCMLRRLAPPEPIVV